MLPQHERAIARAKERLLHQADVLAILVGGSVARKTCQEDSDVDLIAVVTDEGWKERKDRHDLAFVWRDVCDYKGGYVDGKFLPRSFILEAAERGSEPTRHAFIGAFAVHCVDSLIEQAIPRIPVYPEQERQHRIKSFLAQMQVNRGFFWNQAKFYNDLYLKLRAASDIVLFGGRLILAHNRILFPCQKWLMKYVASAPGKPANMVELANQFLGDLTDESKEAFCNAVINFADWDKSKLLGRFIEDAEWSWFTRSYAVAEW